MPVLVAGAYAGPLGSAVRRLKYASRSDLAEPLAQLLAPRARKLCVGKYARLCWAPVPLHPKRLAERGFNQSALVARALARETGGRASPRLLRRVRDTTQQAALGREHRSSNVCSAFAVRHAVRWPIALVDDVVTTGATLTACIDAPQEAGAHVAFAMAIAHAT